MQPEMQPASQAAFAAVGLLSSIGAELGVGMPEEQAAKRQRTAWDGSNPSAAMGQIVPADMQQQGMQAQGVQPQGNGAHAAVSLSMMTQSGQLTANPNFGINQMTAGARKGRAPYIWPRHVDDWRWSKGMEATFVFEEVGLPSGLLSIAKKILGEGSRFPTRVADASDCNVEITAWGSLILRPKGTGGNIDKAKKMLFEVLHPAAESLREEAFEIEDDAPDADAALGEVIGSKGAVNSEMAKELVKNQFRLRTGLGAKDVEEVSETPGKLQTLESVEIPLATSEDVQIVRKHLDHLRMATGSAPSLNGVLLKVYGRGKKLVQAQKLVQTLLETGQWVAFSEQFVLSEETKEKRRGDGPSEQLLIKLPEGSAIKLVEQHLGSMEKAAEADALKLTSKAVGGKRTLMVDGPPKAHERVKLMVKELMEKGESPMLTKFLNGSVAGTGGRTVAFSEMFNPGMKTEVKSEVKTEVKTEVKVEVKQEIVSGGSTVAPGVIAAAAVITVPDALEPSEPPPKKELPTLGAGFKLMAPPTRSAAKSKPTKKASAGVIDLFTDLPEPGGDLFEGLPDPEVTVMSEIKGEVKDEVKEELPEPSEPMDGITE